MAAQCARADIREERRVWTGQRQPRMREQPYRLVFLDETYVNTKMTRLRGRSRRGQRLRAAAPFGPWTTHTFIAGLRCHLPPTAAVRTSGIGTRWPLTTRCPFRATLALLPENGHGSPEG